jgi:uncharacterized protein YggE
MSDLGVISEDGKFIYYRKIKIDSTDLTMMFVVTSMYNNNMSNLIEVSGSAIVKKAPEVARLHIRISFQDNPMELAQLKTNTVGEKVINALKNRQHIKFLRDNRSFHPVTAYDSTTGISKIVNYEYSIDLTIQSKDPENIAEVMDEAIRNGATTVDGLSFSLEESKAAENEALSLATKNAREKAQIMASALGCKLGVIQKVVENGSHTPRFTNEKMMMAASSVSPQVEMPEIQYQAQVTLTITIYNV